MQSFMSVMCRASSHFLDSLSLSLTLQVVVLYSLLLASSSSFSLELLPFSTHTETGVLSSWPLLLLPTNGQKKRNLSAAAQPSMPVVSCLPRGGGRSRDVHVVPSAHWSDPFRRVCRPAHQPVELLVRRDVIISFGRKEILFLEIAMSSLPIRSEKFLK